MNASLTNKLTKVCMVTLLFTLFIYSKELSAETFYVSTSGSDSNSGSLASPFRTIRSGLSRLNSGDTLVIRGGTYSEGIPYFAIPSGLDDLRHTSVQGAPGERVILTGAGPNSDVIEITPRQYVTIDNLELVGGMDGGSGEATNACIRIGEGGGWESSYITIKRSILHHCGAGVFTTGETGVNHDILLQNLTVYHNTSHNIYITGSRVTIENSDVWDAASHGIHIYGRNGVNVSNNVVRNNRIHDNGSFGLLLSSGSDNIAYNNVIYHNGTKFISGGFRFYDGAVNNRFLNNTVVGNNGPGIWIQNGDGAVVENNISFGNSAQLEYYLVGPDEIFDQGSRSTILNNLTSANPGFVNAAAGDFHLTSVSPAIDKGMPLGGLVDTDMDGTPRPQGPAYDLGAFEYSGSPSQPPSPPSAFNAAYLGVTGQDYVGPQLSPNGNPDWHIQLHGLRGTPTKFRITSDNGLWEFPPNAAGNWVILPQYDGAGTADLWFEPWPSQRFHVTVWYSDGSTDESDAH